MVEVMVVEASAVEEGRLITTRCFVLCNFLVNFAAGDPTQHNDIFKMN